jgi:hypothetical protein
MGYGQDMVPTAGGCSIVQVGGSCSMWSDFTGEI